MVLLMVVLGLVAVLGVILYRMSMVAALNLVNQDTITSNASLFISATGATLNLICILVFNQVLENGMIVFILTNKNNAFSP